MPLDCTLPLVELREAFCDLDQAPEDDAVQSVLHLIEESIGFARLVVNLQKNNDRLISVDLSSYPFRETADFFSRISFADLPRADGPCEKWSLPMPEIIIDELREMAPIFAAETKRPELIIVGVLGLNRLFNDFLREVEHNKQFVAIRGATRDIYRCLTSPPLNYNQALRRRLRVPIKTFAAKVYDDNDSASIMQFEVRYDDLPIVQVVDSISDSRKLEFGWDSLLKPSYSKIRGVSWRTTPSTNSQPQNLQEVLCLIPSRIDSMSFSAKLQQKTNLADTAAGVIDDTLCFLRKFEQLKKHNLILALVNTYRTPHEIYEEDFAESINRSLEVLVSFDKYLEKFIEEQKKSPNPYDADGCRYICESKLEEARREQIEIKVELPKHIVDELESYAHYVPVPKERIDLVIAGLVSLFASARSTLHKQRINALTKKESGYRLAIRGLQNDIEKFESACAPLLCDFGNVRVVDGGNSSELMKAWPANAPHPIDVPVYIERDDYLL
ncbi:MAG: hypothetical protein JST44_22350 [Cyanobacteria bacterium SZAS LIN-5]|nr:hypothetical protein [Cyanobacteria bacterium SZAS LIN-5]